ncbi:hypothetical protein BD779DRAFT_1551444 [Infundibulicybe gibba]|nr:hypothetical protein BD779DRAFT_1551444 [Infundibulicybe gibba]
MRGSFMEDDKHHARNNDNGVPEWHLLPVEIVVEVFRHLDYVSLLRCHLVCRAFNKTIVQSSELRCIVELGKAGCVQSIKIRSGYMAYELVAGIFLNSANGDDLLTTWLPSLTDEGKQLPAVSISPRFRDFALDPTQDLIIFLQDHLETTGTRFVKLSVSTLSTRTAHPSSSCPKFEYQLPGAPERISTLAIQIAGDLVAVFLDLVSDAILLIWDWTKGSLLVDVSRGLPTGVYDFSFLDSRAFSITSIMGTKPAHVHIARLHMPPIDLRYQLASMTSHTGPFLGAIELINHSRLPPTRVFMGNHCFVLYVRARTFRSLVTSYYSQSIPILLDLEWDKWGPHQTRLMRQVPRFPWLRFVEGQRVVCPTSQRGTIQVLDFNVLTVTDQSQSSDELMEHVTSPDFSKVTVTGPNHISDDIFAQSVTTCLPFHQLSLKLPRPYLGYMLDEDRIIGLQTEGLFDEKILSLDVYVL